MFNADEVRATLQLAKAMESAVFERINNIAEFLKQNGFRLSPKIELRWRFDEFGRRIPQTILDVWIDDIIYLELSPSLSYNEKDSRSRSAFANFKASWLEMSNEEILKDFSRIVG